MLFDREMKRDEKENNCMPDNPASMHVSDYLHISSKCGGSSTAGVRSICQDFLVDGDCGLPREFVLDEILSESSPDFRHYNYDSGEF